jgi:hypothetical protein
MAYANFLGVVNWQKGKDAVLRPRLMENFPNPGNEYSLETELTPEKLPAGTMVKADGQTEQRNIKGFAFTTFHGNLSAPTAEDIQKMFGTPSKKN